MSHIALLLPSEDQVTKARKVSHHFPAVQEICHVETAKAAEHALQSIKQGARVIIARGLQALCIAQSTNIPVVHIRLTAQEIGLLLLKAKEQCDAPRPRIALVAVSNMLCDTQHCNQLFGVDLKVFSFCSYEEYTQVNRQAAAWNPHIIIGGNWSMEDAKKANIPALFLDSTEESLGEAMGIAEMALYTHLQNLRYTAQVDAILGSVGNGHLQTDNQGTILKMNDILQDIFSCTPEQWEGDNIEQWFPGLFSATVKSVVETGESYSTFLHIFHQSMVVILVPISLEDGSVDGIMVHCNLVHNSIQLDPIYSHGKRSQENLSNLDFGDLHQKSPLMTQVIQQAKSFSQSENPIWLVGACGLERSLLAQCIHNHSLQRNGHFVHINCGGLAPADQMAALFGTGEELTKGETDYGAFGSASNGTLLLLDIDLLVPTVQYALVRALRFRRITRKNIDRLVQFQVRLIATSETRLEEALLEKTFREDLYYLMSGLRLDLPPLRQRKEDLNDILRERFQELCAQLQRYHVLTGGAWKELLSLPWPGNTVQIDSFLERLILTARRRSIDEVDVRRQWNHLYPQDFPHVLYGERPTENEEALRILSLLEQYGGNRGEVARELGVSTTTLWRRMKRYQISNNAG